MSSTIGWLIFAGLVLAIVIVVLARFYKRATREMSLIKTGFGGRKVIKDGGTIAIPYFHEISRVNMQTLRLHTERTGEQALITKDRLRVDVGVEFYVSVIAEDEGISRAAQTLGSRTFQPEKLSELIEGKLIDAVRSVAARLTMDELHENRGSFVKEVGENLTDTLSRNGLELDSVSLTSLDQTPFKALDENNAFNAVGMRKLAEVVAKSKKDRAEIDADADIAVRRALVEVAKQKLLIDLEEQEAEINQTQQIEFLKAAQLAEVARRKAEGEREAARARILMEQDIRSADIAREQAVREAEITKDRELHEAAITGELNNEMVNQDRQIRLAQKSEEKNKAQASADLVMAEAVQATEKISTVKRMAEAERRKELALMGARQEAEIMGTRLRMTAEAEKDAAVDKAEAAMEKAKGDAQAQNIRSEAMKVEMVAEADGKQALNEAENSLSDSIVAMRINRTRLDALPKIVAEMVKPAEKIESIKIHQFSGLGGSNQSSSGGGEGKEKPVVNQAVDAILDMAVQLPAIKRIGAELGISIDDGLTGVCDEILGGGAAASAEKDKDEKD